LRRGNGGQRCASARRRQKNKQRAAPTGAGVAPRGSAPARRPRTRRCARCWGPRGSRRRSKSACGGPPARSHNTARRRVQCGTHRPARVRKHASAAAAAAPRVFRAAPAPCNAPAQCTCARSRRALYRPRPPAWASAAFAAAARRRPHSRRCAAPPRSARRSAPSPPSSCVPRKPDRRRLRRSLRREARQPSAHQKYTHVAPKRPPRAQGRRGC
jgi:hypothetical protein